MAWIIPWYAILLRPFGHKKLDIMRKRVRVWKVNPFESWLCVMKE